MAPDTVRIAHFETSVTYSPWVSIYLTRRKGEDGNDSCHAFGCKGGYKRESVRRLPRRQITNVKNTQKAASPEFDSGRGHESYCVSVSLQDV